MAFVIRDVIGVDMCADLAYDKAANVAAVPGVRRSEMLARTARRSLCETGGGEVLRCIISASIPWLGAPLGMGCQALCA